MEVIVSHLFAFIRWNVWLKKGCVLKSLQICALIWYIDDTLVTYDNYYQQNNTVDSRQWYIYKTKLDAKLVAIQWNREDIAVNYETSKEYRQVILL